MSRDVRQMKRQMDAMTALRSLMVTGELKPTGDEASQERKPFSGWKVKIEYEATDSDGQHTALNTGLLWIRKRNV